MLQIKDAEQRSAQLSALERFAHKKKLPLRFLNEQGLSDTGDGEIFIDYGSGNRARIRKNPDTAHLM
jgi:hypothetical protein